MLSSHGMRVSAFEPQAVSAACSGVGYLTSFAAGRGGQPSVPDVIVGPFA